MDLKKMTKEELETLSYTDLAYYILKEKKKTMNTPSIFKEVCKLLDYSDDEYTSKIGDFYTSLTTDKRFILLDNADWDLRDNHAVKIVVDDEDEIDEEDIEEEIIDDENNIDESSVDPDMDVDLDSNIDDDIDDDIIDDDMDDLEIVEEEELEDN